MFPTTKRIDKALVAVFAAQDEYDWEKSQQKPVKEKTLDKEKSEPQKAGFGSVLTYLVRIHGPENQEQVCRVRRGIANPDGTAKAGFVESSNKRHENLCSKIDARKRIESLRKNRKQAIAAKKAKKSLLFS